MQGSVYVNVGSRTDTTGRTSSLCIPFLTCPSSLVITHELDASLPAAGIVQHGNHGKRFFHTCLSREKNPIRRLRTSPPAAMAFEESITLPPCLPQGTASSPSRCTVSIPFSTNERRGFGCTPPGFDVLHSGPCERLFHPVYQTAFNRAAPAVMQQDFFRHGEYFLPCFSCVPAPNTIFVGWRYVKFFITSVFYQSIYPLPVLQPVLGIHGKCKRLTFKIVHGTALFNIF